ncbi:MAG TPA: hypothetical protein DCR93_03360 [Cytophagales bacterium]|nr:hypothetical protein [Cytophagales bacterium]HAP58576.1 hypothetical protein [Cytophagales bacterium]
MKQRKQLNILLTLFALSVGLPSSFGQEIGFAVNGVNQTGPLGQGYTESPTNRLRRLERNYRLHLAQDRRILIHSGEKQRWLDSANFDIMSNEVLEVGITGDFLFYPADLIDGFVYYDQSKVKHTFEAVKVSETGPSYFLEATLVSGPSQLFIHHRVKEASIQGNPSYGTSSSTSPFQKFSEYYYQLSPDDLPVKFIPSRRVIKQIFEGRSPEVMAYLKVNRFLNLGRLEGVKQVFEVYNASLQ